jgi:microcystin-dependent protein
MQNPFVGQITVFPYAFAPGGWLECAGQLVPVTQYATLFALIGTYFGGNGTTNFGLPDLRGRVPLGMGQLTGGSNYVVGEIGGVESVQIDTNGMPIHNHTINATTTAGSVDDPAGQILAAPFFGSRIGVGSKSSVYNPGPSNTTLVQQSLGFTGGDLPHNNVQPSLVLRPCIAWRGVYPSRN